MLGDHFEKNNKDFAQIREEKKKAWKEMGEGVRLLDRERELKLERLGLELEKTRTELRLGNEREGRLGSENAVLLERNKMLKSWNEQMLMDKKTLNEAIEKIRYEKFNLMKKLDDDFE